MTKTFPAKNKYLHNNVDLSQSWERSREGSRRFEPFPKQQTQTWKLAGLENDEFNRSSTATSTFSS